MSNLDPQLLDFAYRVQKNYDINRKDDIIEKGVTLDDLLSDVQKDLVEGDVIGPSGNTLLSRQNLDAEIIKLDQRMTPLSYDVAKESGSGSAVSFNRRRYLNSKGNPMDAFYPDNGLPPIAKPQYDQLSFPYTRMGWTGGVGNFAMKAGASFGDLYNESLDATLQFLMHTREWCLFHANPNFVNAQGQTPPPGLDYLIQTNIIDAMNQPLSLSLINRAVGRARAMGALPSHGMKFYSSYGQEQALNTIAGSQGDVRINITKDQNASIPIGSNAGYVQSTGLGQIPWVGDFFINPQSGYPNTTSYAYDLFPYDGANNGSDVNVAGNGASTIYLVATKFFKINELEPIVREPLAVVKDGIQYFIKNYWTTKLEAEPFCVKIINCLEPTF